MTEEQRYTEIMLAFEKLHKRIDELESKFKNINSTILDINHRDSKVDPSYWQSPTTTLPKLKCIFDTLSPEDWNKPMGISCPCPRCTPYCSDGSIQSTEDQIWKNGVMTND